MPQVVFRSIFAMLFLWIGPMVWAETPVRLDLGESYVTDRGQGIEVQLRLNRATAYGLRLRDNPMRLIVDLAGNRRKMCPMGLIERIARMRSRLAPHRVQFGGG